MVGSRDTQYCEKKCTISVLELMNTDTRFSNIVQKFITDVQKPKCVINKQYIDFVQKLKDEKYACCEISMQYIESFVFDSVYFNVFYRMQSDKNNFLNNKIILYEWIDFDHLEIRVLPKRSSLYDVFFEQDLYQELVTIAQKLNKLAIEHTPNKKIVVLLEIVNNIYETMKTCKDKDLFLPFVIFVIIKSQVKNIHLHIVFIQNFLREIIKTCQNVCAHVYNTDRKFCSCVNT